MAATRLEREALFQYFLPAQVDRLSDAAKRVAFSAGETIYERGATADSVFIVLDGQVALRLPGRTGISVLIDELTPGALFGRCVSFAQAQYQLTAQCTEDCVLLKIEADVLRRLLEEDPRMGYVAQSWISQIYFRRYIETMQKLQAIIMNIPVDVE